MHSNRYQGPRWARYLRGLGVGVICAGITVASAQINFGQLPAASLPLTGAEVFPANQGATTVQLNTLNIEAYTSSAMRASNNTWSGLQTFSSHITVTDGEGSSFSGDISANGLFAGTDGLTVAVGGSALFQGSTTMSTAPTISAASTAAGTGFLCWNSTTGAVTTEAQALCGAAPPVTPVTGTFTATYHIGASTITRVGRYTVLNNVVTLFFPPGTVNVGTNSAFSITGLPSVIQPITPQNVSAGTSGFEVGNNTATGPVDATINGGTVVFSNSGVITWVGTGNLGIQTSTVIVYTTG
jgi:hypothetical protein